MIIPEINPEHLEVIEHQKKRLGTSRGFICVKPNCSIQSYTPVLTAWKKFEPTVAVVTTYQAISGAGKTFKDWPEMEHNIIPFIGGGIGRTMTYDMYAMDLSAGVQAQFRLNKKFAVHAELGWNRFEGDIDGGLYGWGNRGWDSHDNNLYAELGVTFNLGKATWDKTPDVDAINAQHQAALDALNAKLRDAQNENDRLRNMLANQKPAEPAKAVKDLIATPVSVFFNLDKTNIASQKDLVNVRALAKFAKDEDRNLLVTGYADSATGTPEHNQWLSERRAETVANEIVKMGVDESRITTVGKGGVDILSPVSFNRRATVQVTE
jgi:outer membrane protein OmpA-like peptidoglycan-associated protein